MEAVMVNYNHNRVRISRSSSIGRGSTGAHVEFEFIKAIKQTVQLVKA